MSDWLRHTERAITKLHINILKEHVYTLTHCTQSYIRTSTHRGVENGSPRTPRVRATKSPRNLHRDLEQLSQSVLERATCENTLQPRSARRIPRNDRPPFWFYGESIRTSVHGSHIVMCYSSRSSPKRAASVHKYIIICCSAGICCESLWQSETASVAPTASSGGTLWPQISIDSYTYKCCHDMNA